MRGRSRGGRGWGAERALQASETTAGTQACGGQHRGTVMDSKEGK